MCHGKFGGGCTMSMVGKVLVIVGGVNWGILGGAMLMGKTMEEGNVLHMIVGSMPTFEAIVYVLVGLAAVMMIFGCRCKKCMEACASCNASGADKQM